MGLPSATEGHSEHLYQLLVTRGVVTVTTCWLPAPSSRAFSPGTVAAPSLRPLTPQSRQKWHLARCASSRTKAAEGGSAAAPNRGRRLSRSRCGGAGGPGPCAQRAAPTGARRAAAWWLCPLRLPSALGPRPTRRSPVSPQAPVGAARKPSRLLSNGGSRRRWSRRRIFSAAAVAAGQGGRWVGILPPPRTRGSQPPSPKLSWVSSSVEWDANLTPLAC